MIARSIMIQGKVQGVFFREWTVSRAREMGLGGWVRNRKDGSVEVYAVGEEASLDRFVERLREGSPASRVDRVVDEDAPVEALHGFTRRESA